MSDLRKVYLPRWMTRLSLVMLVVLWLYVTWETHFAGGPESSVAGWVAATAVTAVMVVVLVLMGRRKLPVYLLDLEDEEEDLA